MTMMKTAQNKKQPRIFRGFFFCITNLDKLLANIYIYAYDKFDIILFDSPPINVVTDTMILCNKADGVVMVCAIEKSKREALLETKKKIESMGGNLIGLVINWMPLDKIKEYTKAYGKYSENQIIKYSNKGIS